LITTAYQIGLYWEDGPFDGGSPIIDYRVNMRVSDYNNTEAQWSIYQESTNDIPFTVTGLIPSVIYDFKVEALNLVNHSDYSEVTTIRAAQIPDPPILLSDVPEITLADRIGLVWSAPGFNGGAPILDYRLWFDDASGTTFQILESGLHLSHTTFAVRQGEVFTFKV
jgi:hypothetical protein